MLNLTIQMVMSVAIIAENTNKTRLMGKVFVLQCQTVISRLNQQREKIMF